MRGARRAAGNTVKSHLKGLYILLWERWTILGDYNLSTDP